MTFAIHGIFEAIFRPGVVIIRRNRPTITPHYALPGQKIALKSPRSGKCQQTRGLTFAIHRIFEAIFRPGVVIIRRNRPTITPHYALPGQKIALKPPRSDKRQQTLVEFGTKAHLMFNRTT